MGNLKVALAVACAVVVGWAGVAQADISVSSYRQRDHLIAQWDGIDNVGTGVHDATATVWKDLSGNGNDLTLVAKAGSFVDGLALYCNNAMGCAKATSTISNYRTIEIAFKTEKGNDKQCILNSGVQDRFAWHIVASQLQVQFSQKHPTASVPDSFGFNCIAATYSSDSATEAAVPNATWTGGAHAEGKYDETWSSRPSVFTIGWGSNSSRTFKGRVYAVRLYDCELSDEDIAWNAMLDKIRFAGAGDDYRIDETTGKVEVRVKIVAPRGGKVSVDGADPSAESVAWVPVGSTKTVKLVAIPDDGAAFVDWIGDIGSVDVKSAAVTATLKAEPTQVLARFRRAGDGLPYIQRGLVTLWDGIDNAGVGQHFEDLRVWKDLVGDFDLTLTDAGSFEGGNALFVQGCAAAFGPRGTFAYRTLDIAYKMTTASGRCLFASGCKTGNAGFSRRWVLFDANGTKLYADGSGNAPTKYIANTVQTGVRRNFAATYGMDNYVTDLFADGQSAAAPDTMSNSWGTGDGVAMIGDRTKGTTAQSWAGYVYGLRLYDVELTPQEIAYNAALDKVRFDGVDSDEVTWPDGYRYDAETEHTLIRVTLAGNDGAQVSADGESWSDSATVWCEQMAPQTFFARPSTGKKLLGWTSLPAGAVVSGMSVSFVVSKPVVLSPVVADEGVKSSSSLYVQNGLVAQWDGIDNAGEGFHEASSEMWKDLKGSCDLTLPVDGCTINENSIDLANIQAVATGLPCAQSATPITLDGSMKLKGTPTSTASTAFISVTSRGGVGYDVRGTQGICFYEPSSTSWGSQLMNYFWAGNFKYSDPGRSDTRHTFAFVSSVTASTSAYAKNTATPVYQDGVQLMSYGTGWNSGSASAAPNGSVYIGSTGAAYEVNAVRIYDRQLSAGEIACNANIDKMRFEGADPSSLIWPEGYAYDAESGKLRWKYTFKAPEGGSVSVDGETLTEDCVLWADNGDVVERVLVAAVDIDHNFEGWEGDVGAIVGGDVKSPTITVRAKSSITLTPRFVFAPKLFVSTEGVDGEGRGTLDAPCRSIGFAVDHAVEGHEIHIAGGLYEESVTNRDDKTGKGAIKFIGSWKGDFSERDLRNCRTIVRPPEAFLKKVPCFMVSAFTNRFDGIDMTGGSYGVVDPCGWVFGSIGKTHGGNDNTVIHHEIRHCVMTNNTYALGSGWEGFAVASSLIAKNGTGFFQQADHGTVSYFHNCTFADNTNYALYQNHSYNAAFVTRNCIFVGNGYVLRTTNGGKSFYDSCFGPQVLAYFYDSTKRYSLYGECPFKDPMLDEEYAPREGSPVLQVGPSLAQNATLPVVDDLYGEPWESDGYDLGCIKSEYKKVPVVKYAVQYVSMTGDDANEGTTPETARASVQAALDHIAPTGVVRVLKGRYTGIANIMDAGVTVEGESRDETVVVSSDKGQFPGLDVKAHNVTIRNLTLENGNAGVYVEQFATADKCMISNCVMRANNCGVTLVGGSNDGTSGGHWTHVSHCWITNNTSHGLNAGSTYRMDNCLIARNSGYGVNGTYGDRYTQSIAVNCTVADNTGAYGVFANDSWAGSQAFYDCVLSGHKTGVYRNGVNYSGGVNLYSSVLCNLTNIGNTAGASRIVKDAATIEVDDMQYDTARSRLYWPSESSPALGMAHSRNATLAVKVYESLNGRKLKPTKPYAAGCYQLPAPGMLIFVR